MQNKNKSQKDEIDPRVSFHANELDIRIHLAAHEFFINGRSDTAFVDYFNITKPEINRISFPILKDKFDVEENFTIVIHKLWANKKFVFDNDKNHGAYIRRITTNSALTILRKRKKSEISFSQLEFAECDNEKDRSSLIETKLAEKTESTEECMSQYIARSKHKAVINYLQKTYDEDNAKLLIDAIINNIVYEKLKIIYGYESTGAIKTRVHRARKKLRVYFNSDEYLICDNSKQQTITHFHKNGQRKIVAEVLTTNDDKHGGAFPHGICSEFFDNANIKAEYYYENGKKHGHCIVYYKNGKKHQEGEYVDNVRHGEWTRYAPDGTILEIVDYWEGSAGFYKYYEDDVIVESGLININETDKRHWNTDSLVRGIVGSKVELHQELHQEMAVDEVSNKVLEMFSETELS